ncbi:transcription factor Cys6, partial [Metarhizium majus ARSEF 297]
MQLDERKESIIAAVNDELARFKLWSENIGAHRTGPTSLDHRLRDSSPLRQQVARLLDELTTSIDEVEAILSGKATPWDEEVIDGCDIDAELKEILGDEKFEFDSELAQLSVDIGDIINSLLRLSTSIRNPAPHDHFMSTEYAEDGYFSDFDVRHVEAKYKDANQDLVRRLGKAISRRRRYFKYRESHHAKLSQGLDLDQGCTEAGQKSTVASSVPLAMKDPGNSAPLFGELDEDDHSETGNSQTSYATTAPESEKLRVPTLPEQYKKGPFQCPFCFMLISVTNRIQWKQHVMSDLRPYMCLFENCLTADKEYSRRHEWMDHVLQKHWKTWRCPGSCQGYWSSEASLKRHVQEAHSDIVSTGDLNASIARNERMKPLDAKTECPLCRESLDSIKQYQQHVGKHLVDLALFALPKTGDREDSDDFDEMGDDKVVDSSELDEDNNVDDNDERETREAPKWWQQINSA